MYDLYFFFFAKVRLCISIVNSLKTKCFYNIFYDLLQKLDTLIPIR